VTFLEASSRGRDEFLPYKDVSRVAEVVHWVGSGKKIARLEPIIVIKG
jgi:RNA-splicing ligase RtcB